MPRLYTFLIIVALWAGVVFVEFSRLPFGTNGPVDLIVRAMLWGSVLILSLRWTRNTEHAWPTWVAALVGMLAIVLCFNWSALSPRWWFLLHKPLYEVARDTDQVSGVWGKGLPAWLRPLTANGRVSGPRHARFFPQVLVGTDNHGGYFYAPKKSPAKRDMIGVACTDPIEYGDGWWSCGLPDR